MIDNKAVQLIEEAVKREKDKAISNHGHFHSHNEAWAVLKEECEEVTDALLPFGVTAGDNLLELWEMVKGDCVHEKLDAILEIRQRAKELVQEGVQVMAVCDKWKSLIKKESKA